MLITKRKRERRSQDLADLDRNYSRVEFVCRPEQKVRWQAAADAAGMSLSAWLVLVADGAL